jgi:hypothetical protein
MEPRRAMAFDVDTSRRARPASQDANASARRGEPEAEEKRQALEAVLGSAAFLRAGLQCSFLRYVCEMEIAGRGAELSEYQIGVEALGRSPGYSTGDDSSVRRHAHDLRQRLEEAYAAELSEAPVRIELPKGRYAPRFLYRRPAAPPVPTVPVEVPQTSRRRVDRVGAFVLGLLGGVVLAAAVVLVQHVLQPARPVDPSQFYEAEARSTVLTGEAVRAACEACSGGGAVHWIGHGSTVTFEVEVREDGEHMIQIDYKTNGIRTLLMSVNDGPETPLRVRGRSFAVPASTAILTPLHLGRNTIRFRDTGDYSPDLDRIVVR